MDNYKILNIEPTTKPRDIILAYRVLARKYQGKNDEKYKLIVQAYYSLLGNFGASIQCHKDYIDNEIREKGRVKYCISQIEPDGYELLNYFKEKYKLTILKQWNEDKNSSTLENEYCTLYEISKK